VEYPFFGVQIAAKSYSDLSGMMMDKVRWVECARGTGKGRREAPPSTSDLRKKAGFTSGAMLTTENFILSILEDIYDPCRDTHPEKEQKTGFRRPADYAGWMMGLLMLGSII
jgi:hypothetical protein